MQQSNPTNATETAHKASFFRQSGWLMFSNIAGGVFMWAVHLLNGRIPQGSYGAFGTLLAVVMLVPTIPLQMIMAQQTAKALALGRDGELSSLIRWMLLGTALVWVLGAVIVFAFQTAILNYWRMPGEYAVLWITMAIVLLSLWMPIFMGALQGKQNFLWLGWVMMSNALGRISIAAGAVLLLDLGAGGMISGVLVGMLIALLLGAWHSRSLWLITPQPFDRRAVIEQIVPLFIGFLGFQFLFTADTLFVKGYFTAAQSDSYVSAGTLSRALMWLVLPLAAVMFPRIVHSAARSEKTNLMNLVLCGTAVLAIVGAAGLAVVGPFVVRIIYAKQAPAQINMLLPWYAAAMVPLSVANVLLNNLLARPALRLLPSLCVLVVGVAYLIGLTQFHASRVMVLQVMGIGNLLLLAVCAWFTWTGKTQPAVGQVQPAKTA